MAGGGLFIRRSQGVKQPEIEYGSIEFTGDSTSPSVSSNNDDDDADLTDVKSRKMSTISSGVVNLANTIVGAGMLGLPGAFGGTGWLSGIILIVVSAIFSAHGLVLLSKSAIITGKPASFYSVAHASVPRYTMLIDAAVAVKCFGVATGYLITISDSMVNALHHMLMSGDSEREQTFIISLLLSRHFWVCGATLSVLPLSFYRTLDELKKASALALVFVFMLVGMILAYANGLADPCSGFNNDDNSEHETCKGDMEPYTNLSSTISKLPIFVFAFTCHQNIFPIVNELELLSQKRLNIVISCSIGFALVIFSTVAIEGYRTYGSNVRGDILLNYPENRQVTFLRICIGGMLGLHYPLQLGKCF
jgi:amino acid permease